MFRETLYDRPVARVEERDNTVFVHEGKYNNIVVLTDLLHPFPAGMCKNEQDRQALLTHWACTNSLAWMHDLLKYLAPGENPDSIHLCIQASNGIRTCTKYHGSQLQGQSPKETSDCGRSERQRGACRHDPQHIES